MGDFGIENILGDMERIEGNPNNGYGRSLVPTLPLATRVVSVLEWLHVAGIDAKAMYVSEASFSRIVDEYRNGVAGAVIDETCNMVTVPGQDGRYIVIIKEGGVE